ncbi:MAG: hypothetical protein QGH60_19115 [Phycisphaerae bacterium]|jgi:hypothetical protein|nr:hypothetical protein [Phycisphaerae bacterium]
MLSRVLAWLAACLLVSGCVEAGSNRQGVGFLDIYADWSAHHKTQNVITVGMSYWEARDILYANGSSYMSDPILNVYSTGRPPYDGYHLPDGRYVRLWSTYPVLTGIEYLESGGMWFPLEAIDFRERRSRIAPDHGLLWSE